MIKKEDNLKDELYDEVFDFVIKSQKVDIVDIGMRFNIGFARVMRIINQLEENRIIEIDNNTGERRFLIDIPLFTWDI